MRHIEERTFYNWNDFQNFLSDEKLQLSNYIFRGQKNSTWLLESKAERLLKQEIENLDNPVEYIRKLRSHLNNFRYAVRGRRGINPPDLVDDNLWALGQHYGLATPLLDWTESPYVATFFAYYETIDEHDDTNHVVFGLHHKISDICQKIGPLLGHFEAIPKIHHVKPQLDENYRLINQRGLFTQMKRGNSNFCMDIEKWINTYIPNSHETITPFLQEIADTILYRIELPSNMRDKALRILNTMNISHQTLFPDLEGAALYCNAKIELGNY
jgi:hypothetical protein